MDSGENQLNGKVMVYRHVFFTWLFGNLIHPIVWLCISPGVYMQTQFSSGQMISAIFFTAVASLPLLVSSGAILNAILRSGWSHGSKYLCWVFLVTVTLIAFITAICVLTHYFSIRHGLSNSLPAVIAFWVIAAVRYRFFLGLEFAFARNREIPPDYTEFEKLKSEQDERKQ
jgi:hypothetical protein